MNKIFFLPLNMCLYLKQREKSTGRLIFAFKFLSLAKGINVLILIQECLFTFPTPHLFNIKMKC